MIPLFLLFSSSHILLAAKSLNTCKLVFPLCYSNPMLVCVHASGKLCMIDALAGFFFFFPPGSEVLGLALYTSCCKYTNIWMIALSSKRKDGVWGYLVHREITAAPEFISWCQYLCNEKLKNLSWAPSLLEKWWMGKVGESTRRQEMALSWSWRGWGEDLSWTWGSRWRWKESEVESGVNCKQGGRFGQVAFFHSCLFWLIQYIQQGDCNFQLVFAPNTHTLMTLTSHANGNLARLSCPALFVSTSSLTNEVIFACSVRKTSVPQNNIETDGSYPCVS